MTTFEHGPIIGTYRDKPIHDWIRWSDGAFGYFVGVTGTFVEMAKLRSGEVVVSPGLIYRVRK